MKKFLTVFTATALTAGMLLFAGCSAYNGAYAPDASESLDNILYSPDGENGNYDYESIVEKGFSTVEENPSSYFSLDRNTATYSLVRRQINDNIKVYPNSVRIEEMINYFDYSFPAPEEKAVSVNGYLADCPWSDNKLMLAGIKTAECGLETTNANYVFLIDVSGSMSGDDRLGLAKYGLNKLTDGLSDSDVVSIVTYASGVKTVLDGGECTADGKTKIKAAINGLNARGATNGGDGLERAYNIAKKHYITGGNNRVIIISDGDFNVGATSVDVMKEFIQEKADTGVYLSVLGVGMGNTRDTMLETLATCGNGNYAYLDSKLEAEKVFVEELNGTLKTVAKDAKAGVTFTKNVVKYRLVGYDSKLISEDDFNNDKTDTGEIGSGLCVTALYEIEIADNAEGKLADIEVRYKDVRDEEVSDSVSCEVTTLTPTSDDLSFISCVAEFGLILRNSKYKDIASLYSVLQRLTALSAYISGDSYKTEFKTLVNKAAESGYYEPVDEPTENHVN